MYKDYLVTWESYIDAESAEEAVVKARELHREGHTSSLLFTATSGACDEPEVVELDETCSYCGFPCSSKNAHSHHGEIIGECCWDERLRMTE